MYLGLWIAALSAGFVWQLTPFPAVLAIRSLSHPAQLATLGYRGANPRLNKIVYWLDDARRHFVAPKTALDLALWLEYSGARAALVKESLLRNLKIADELGLFAEGNRRRCGCLAHARRKFFEAGDVPALADAMLHLAVSPDLRRRLGDAGLELAREELSFDGKMDLVLASYRRAMGG